jgi:hypothetical protein
MTNHNELKSAHKFSRFNKKAIQESEEIACFYCCKRLIPSDIKEWCDKLENEATALCPICGIDSLIPSSSLKVTNNFLKEMQDYWFNTGYDPQGNKFKIINGTAYKL